MVCSFYMSDFIYSTSPIKINYYLIFIYCLIFSGDVELVSFKSIDSSTNTSTTQESSVFFIITDETTTNWQNSRFNHTLPFSTSIDSLYSIVASDASKLLNIIIDHFRLSVYNYLYYY